MTAAYLSKLSLQLRRHGANQALLFTGAGFSAGASNISDKTVPSGRDLIANLKSRTGEDIDDLGLLSRLFMEKFGEHEMFQLLTTEFRCKQVVQYHRDILSFPWKSVYTTNYDDVAEKAASEAGIATRTYWQQQHPSEIATSSLPIVHLNGYINEITFQNFQRHIKLTNVSYLSDDVSRSVWGPKFRGDILTSVAIIFVGYSMFDLDIARIIFEFPDMKDRIYFVTEPNPPRSLQVKFSDFGKTLDIGLAAFADFLRRVRSEGIERKALYFTSVERVHRLNALVPKPTDAQVRDLLVLGDVDEDILASDLIRGTQDYVLRRDCIAKISEIISNGARSNVILSASLGNGKSVCARMIGHKLVAAGAEAFRIETSAKQAMEQLNQIRDIEGKKVFIIDDLFQHFDTVRAIRALNFPDYAIIACVRAATFDLRRTEVSKLFDDDFFDFDLDILSADERTNLIRFFDTYGYWRDLHRTTNIRKQSFLIEECSSELRTVLLHFLDAQPIKQKIGLIFGGDGVLSSESAQMRRLLILAQMINLAGQKPAFSIMSDILDFDTYRAASQASGQYKEFLKVRGGELALRSPILSEYIIRSVVDTDHLIGTMIDIQTRLDELYDSDDSYKELMKTFVRFRFLEAFLPPDKKRDFLIKFYENVKSLNHFKRESLFWLQYAIARLSLQEFQEAKLLFDAAYAFAKAMGYTENKHLDNQYARYLLESRTLSEDYSDYISAFKQAHQILQSQMNREPLSYRPYRVIGRCYLSFVQKRRDQLSLPDRIFVVKAALEILRRIAGASPKLKQWSEVQQCEKGLRQISSILSDAVAPTH